jgi:hypothetical protein
MTDHVNPQPPELAEVASSSEAALIQDTRPLWGPPDLKWSTPRTEAKADPGRTSDGRPGTRVHRGGPAKRPKDRQFPVWPAILAAAAGVLLALAALIVALTRPSGDPRSPSVVPIATFTVPADASTVNPSTVP